MSKYKDIFNLKNKHIVINGGLGLLGTEITLALNEFGANLTVIDNNKKKTNLYKKKLNSINFLTNDSSDTKSIIF